MAAIVEIDELNQGGIVTHGVFNLNVGNVDQPTIVVSPQTAITLGENAYQKYNRMHFLDFGEEVQAVHTLRIWMNNPDRFNTGESIQTNLVQVGVNRYIPGLFKTPSRDTHTKYAMPCRATFPAQYKEEPTMPDENDATKRVAAPNIGIKGSLFPPPKGGGVITRAEVEAQADTPTSSCYSDIWVWQLQTTTNIAPGALSSKEFTFKWEEDLVSPMSTDDVLIGTDILAVAVHPGRTA